ncbi:alpha/beta-hydrolase [Hypoxylon trugodes]|uniref:alpha/beta-hydrolase n=1 Tax=Hypoxylon trugodes TaxID=326681 RepID=UPI00218CB0F0|nr:alpha/beta-hydrolase [Hypoxylon trugodes]KAI1387651.1 alpha/beta-hydrolase [Hypoxylon trugodes]
MADEADPGMHYAYFKANDGCTLAFQTSLPIGADAKPDNRYGSCIVLLHGFSGSSAYFTRNFQALSQKHWVVAPDMRGHGNSTRTRGGYHVARLAADLRDLVTYLRAPTSRPSEIGEEIKFVPVGCSIGAAILWTSVEIYGPNGGGDFAGFVFVDQAPLQDRSLFDKWDASRAHTGCYDEATMQAAQKAWIEDPPGTHIDLVKSCLGYRHAPDDRDDLSDERRWRDEAFFTRISQRCDGEWLARLLADHTRYDHREAIEENIRVPTLVLAGRRSGCFPLEGMRETVRRVESGAGPGLARMAVFKSGHWLFFEEPERFNAEVVEFVDSCVSR